VFILEIRETHYEDLGKVLKGVIQKNSEVLNPYAIPYDFIISLKIDYNIEDIKNRILIFHHENQMVYSSQKYFIV
jgi:hypothetical protein